MRWLAHWSYPFCDGEHVVSWESARSEATRSQSPMGALTCPPGLKCGTKHMGAELLTWQCRWRAPALGEWWRVCSGGQQGRYHWFSLRRSWCSLQITPPDGRGPCPERTSLMSQKTGRKVVQLANSVKTKLVYSQGNIIYFSISVQSLFQLINSDNV